MGCRLSGQYLVEKADRQKTEGNFAAATLTQALAVANLVICPFLGGSLLLDLAEARDRQRRQKSERERCR